MDKIINVKMVEETVSFIDYLPYIISILSIIMSLIIVFIQYRQNIKLQKKAIIYNAKKEALYEVLSFVDAYISWLTPSSGIIPVREKTTKLKMTSEARLSYNKLCLYCNNNKLLKLFWDIVNPDNKGQLYPVYSLYNDFRNECRNELGIKKKDLPSENIFLSIISTEDLERFCEQ